MADSVVIEARAYGPDSTPEEIEAIRARASVHSEDIILFRELPVMSTFSVDLMSDRVEELHATHGCEFLIVDSLAGARPDAPVRRRLRERAARLEGRLVGVGVVILAHPLIKVASLFVQRVMPFPLTLHATLAEAEAAMREAGAR